MKFFLLNTVIIDFSQKMNSQSLQLIPNSNVLFEERLQFLELLFLEWKFRLIDNNRINLIVLLKSEKKFQNNSIREFLEESLENENVSLLSTDLQHIMFAVTSKISNYLHGYFREIKKFIVWFLNSFDRYFEKFILNLLKFILGIAHT